MLAVAGAWQLSPVSRRCLRACRSPFGFLARGWTGSQDRRRQGWRIGTRYGISRLGCCLHLMLAMAVAALAASSWVLVLAAMAVLAKVLPNGPQIARWSGVALALAGLGITVATL